MILALEVDFLTGRCVATDRENRNRPEWPPHPDRLFAALAAAYFERKADPEAETPEEQAEREALEWLSAQRNLSLNVPDHCQRTAVHTYVPVNDSDQLKKKGEPHSRIGEGWEFRRNRQERTFPTVLPDPPTMVYRWEVRDLTAVERHRPALARLAANVSYLGHSSSLVRVCVHPNPPAANLRLAQSEEPAKYSLRVPHLGRLQQLSHAYQLSRRFNRRIEPQKALELGFVSVNKAKDRPAQTHFDDDLIVFRKTDGPYLPLHAVMQLTSTVRRALISLAVDPVPAVLSGHEPDGKTLSAVHLAIVPLANVDHRHADGDIKGFALVLPRWLRQREQRSDYHAVLRAIRQLEKLTMGRSGVWRVEQVLPGSSPLKSLTPSVWTKPSTGWASVTPLVFGRFPKRRGTSKRDWMSSPDVIKMIQEQIQMVGLQDEHGEPLVPKCISVVPASPILGVPPSSQFPSLSTAGKPLPPRARGRLRAHVALEFDREVQGPLILGAGRYLGMGFFRPFKINSETEEQHASGTK